MTEAKTVGWHHWLDGHEQAPGVGMDREAWCVIAQGVSKSQIWLSNWSELNCGQETLRGNGVTLKINRRVWNWVQFQKWQNNLGSFPRQTIQCHSYPSLCPKHWWWRSWSWPLYKDLQELLELTPRYPFHHRELECKSRRSRDTWNNRQIWPWRTKWSRAKANRVLSREHTGHSKHLVATTQGKTLHMDITRWSILKSDWLCPL